MNKPGFLLVEILIAVSLLLCCLVATSALLHQTNRTIALSKEKQQAVYCLQSQMEELRALPFNDLLAKNKQSFAQNKGQIIVSQVSSSLLFVQVELIWKQNKLPLIFRSLRSCYE